MPAHIEVIPLGRLDQSAVKVVAANLQTFVGLPVDVLEPRPSPVYALIGPRMQYDAVPILNELAKDPAENRLRIGLVSEDLCLPILSHVFGEARVGGRTAVVSCHRLLRNQDGLPVGTELFLERLAKVAVHETAHALGLKHCRTPGCLMLFSAGLRQIDALELEFCRNCTEKLQDLVRGRTDQPAGPRSGGN